MKYFNVFIFFFVTFQIFIAQFIKDLIVNFIPSLGHMLIHTSTSDSMRQTVMQPGWQDWPYIHATNDFNIFAELQLLAYLIIPALIFCIPLFLTLFLYHRCAFYFIPVTVGLGALIYGYLLNEFNPDAQGALVIIFGPIYALIPMTISAIIAWVIDRFILKLCSLQ